jgi:hypothetical protein
MMQAPAWGISLSTAALALRAISAEMSNRPGRPRNPARIDSSPGIRQPKGESLPWRDFAGSNSKSEPS